MPEYFKTLANSLIKFSDIEEIIKELTALITR